MKENSNNLLNIEDNMKSMQSSKIRSTISDGIIYNSTSTSDRRKFIDSGKTNFSNNDGGHKKKQLVLFSINMSEWSSLTKFISLSFGLFLFSCAYGYFQEFVVYNWFHRKYYLFFSFIHLFGNSLCAVAQKLLTSGLAPMPRKSPWKYHIILIFLKTFTQILTNMSMVGLNYPAKVLFKSANPLVTMIIGLILFNKRYSLVDYMSVVFIVAGIVIFLNGKSAQAPQGTFNGILFVVLSMFGAAAVPLVQEYCMHVYNSKPEELLYFSFLGAAAVSLVIATISGELQEGLDFMYTEGDFFKYFAFVCFCTFGYLGANCGAALTQQFGALVNGLTNTARKAITLGLSFALFPERNTFQLNHLYGALVFFAGLLLKSFYRKEKNLIKLSKSDATLCAQDSDNDCDDFRTASQDNCSDQGANRMIDNNSGVSQSVSSNELASIRHIQNYALDTTFKSMEVI